MGEERIISLENLKGGAAIEMFDNELQRVLDNIVDINTDPKAIREVSLKVKIKPDEDREVGTVTISAAAKVAPIKSVDTVLFIGDVEGKAVATERDPKQPAFQFAKGGAK